MKPSKEAAILFIALCFLSLVTGCESERKNATKQANRNTSASQRAGAEPPQQSGNQNVRSDAEDPASVSQAEEDKAEADPALSNRDLGRKESSILGAIVDFWSNIVFPFGVSLLLAATVYSLVALKRRISEVEKFLYTDLGPKINDIKNAQYGDKSGQGKPVQEDSTEQADRMKLNADVKTIKDIAERIEMEWSGLKDELRKGNGVKQEADEGKTLEETPEADTISAINTDSAIFAKSKVPTASFVADLGQRVNQPGGVPFPIPISVADCLRYLERENVSAIEVKGEGLREGAVFVQASGGKFLLITSPGNARKECFVIPKVSRFATIQDYTHYQKYYDCDDPSSGDVWIIRPAIVVPDSERQEWRLTKKGQLEIRT